MTNDTGTPALTKLALIQGLYFLLNGIWPIIHIESFMAVTGPKEDIWLVKTVGMLTIAIGTGLCAAGIKKSLSSSIIIVAIASAIGFIAIDVTYVLKDVILPVYLLDAAIELLLVVFWVFFLSKTSKV